jgi:hypothetical protein
MARRNTFDLTSNSGLYVTTVIMAVVVIFGFMAYLVLVLNLQPINTIKLPPGMPGMLTTEVYKSARFWLSMWMLPWKGLFVIWLLLAVAWGNKSTGCSWFWFSLLVVVTLADALSFTALSVDASRANRADQKGNFFNDPLWCCVHGDKGIDATGCPSDVKCFAPIDMRPDITGMVEQSDLMWNNDAKWLFHAGWMFLLYFVVFYAIIFTSLCWEPSVMPSDRDPFNPAFQPRVDEFAPLKRPPEAVDQPMRPAPTSDVLRQRHPHRDSSIVDKYGLDK